MRLIPRLPFRLTLPRVAIASYVAFAATLWYLLPPQPKTAIILPEKQRILGFSRDGETIVTGEYKYSGQVLVIGNDDDDRGRNDGIVRLWDCRTADLRASVDCRGRWCSFSGLTNGVVWFQTFKKKDGKWDLDQKYCERREVSTGRLISETKLNTRDQICSWLSDENVLLLELPFFDKWRLTTFDFGSQAHRVFVEPDNEEAGRVYPASCTSEEGRMLAVQFDDRTRRVRIWNLETGQEDVILKLPPGELSSQSIGWPLRFAFSRDGRMLGIHRNLARLKNEPPMSSVQVWDTSTGDLIGYRVFTNTKHSAGSTWENVLLVSVDRDASRLQLLDPLSG